MNRLVSRGVLSVVSSALLLAGLLAGPQPAYAANITVDGTPGADLIFVNAKTGQVTVNGNVTQTFTSRNNKITVNGNGGADTITIDDGPGNSRYSINGGNLVSLNDDKGNDRYILETDTDVVDRSIFVND